MTSPARLKSGSGAHLTPAPRTLSVEFTCGHVRLAAVRLFPPAAVYPTGTLPTFYIILTALTSSGRPVIDTLPSADALLQMQLPSAVHSVQLNCTRPNFSEKTPVAAIFRPSFDNIGIIY